MGYEVFRRMLKRMRRYIFFVGAACWLLGSLPREAFADQCSVQVAATDQMTFDTDRIAISRGCSRFTVKLVHSGKLPVEVMGHNWVLTRQEDVRQVAVDGMKAGPAAGYLPANDPRVIAATAMIGGGQTASVSFDPAQLGGAIEYAFFCSFPGHVAMMRGTLKLTD